MKNDVLIIGGGVIGSSLAYFLSSNKDFHGKITVIEKDPSYKNCSSSLSVGGIRHQFSTPENIQISLFGTEFFKNIDDYLRIDEPISLYFRENGYLFLGTEHGKESMTRNLQMQNQLGSEGVFLNNKDLNQKFPWLNTEDIIGGNFGMKGEGWIDPFTLLQAFKRKAQNSGVKYLKTAVIGFKKNGNTISDVILEDGSNISTRYVVNAAGCNASIVNEYAGIRESPVESRKRQVHVFRCKEHLPNAPMVIDPSGVYFRPEGKQFICGRSPDPEIDKECYNYDLDFSQFEDEIWPVLAHRVPIFEAIRREHSWAGHYAYNTIDQNAIIGFHPEVNNLIMANGFSGHGLQQAPAVGRGITELLVEGQYQTIDLSVFSFERFNAGKLIRETEIV